MTLTSSSYSDDFYKFNLFADEHLITLYGDHPRNWLSNENKIAYDNINVVSETSSN